MKKILIQFILGSILLALGICLALTIGETFLLSSRHGNNLWWFLGGMGIYLLVHAFLYRPVLSHVMAHEVTHALTAMLLGGKVSAIHATTSGGSTIINKSHWLISLSPYVFPLYTAMAVGIYFLAAPSFKPPLLGLVGFTYAFHLALTLVSLAQKQPDIRDAGPVFSLIFIFAANMIVLTLLLTVVWPEALSVSQASQRAWYWANFLAHAWVRIIHREGLP